MPSLSLLFCLCLCLPSIQTCRYRVYSTNSLPRQQYRTILDLFDAKQTTFLIRQPSSTVKFSTHDVIDTITIFFFFSLLVDSSQFDPRSTLDRFDSDSICTQRECIPAKSVSMHHVVTSRYPRKYNDLAAKIRDHQPTV